MTAERPHVIVVNPETGHQLERLMLITRKAQALVRNR